MLVVAIVASAVTAVTGLVPAAATVSALPGQSVQAVQIRPPSNAPHGASSFLYGVSCLRSESCTAGGSYVDSSGDDQAMVVTESGEHWARAAELRLPAGAPHQPFAEVNSVACTAVGSCIAGGYYSISGNFQGFVATQSHGTWSRARQVTLPANTHSPSDFQVTAVTCTGLGTCVAIGGYQDSHGRFEALAATESNGTWGTAKELRMPANALANPDAFLSALSCARPGSCVAAGNYANKADVDVAVTVAESGGTWHRGIEVALPPGSSASSQASVESVACLAAGSCEAVGEYADHTDAIFPFTMTESKGHWRRAAKFTKLPANAAPHPAAELMSVSCPAAGSCVAIGGYLDKAGGQASFAAFRRHGKWLTAVQIKPPGNAASGGVMRASITGVSCTSAGFCAAVGNYATSTAGNAAMGATP